MTPSRSGCPTSGLLLVPVALGLALSAGAVVAAFGHDVAGRRFGWRQPVAVVAIAAVVFGVLPAVADDRRRRLVHARAPASSTLVEAPMFTADEVGDYRVLYLGDPRLIPFPSDELGGDVAMALVDDGGADLGDRWPVPDQDADEALRAVIDEIGDASTLRAGRLLAPFGIRYVVVPLIDGATSTAADPLPVPAGLLASLEQQLDLVRPPISAPGFVLFENRAVIPTTSALEGALAEASTADDLDGIVAVDTSTAVPDAPRSRRHRARPTPMCRRASSTSARRWTAGGSLEVGGEEVARAIGVRRRHRLRRRHRRVGVAAGSSSRSGRTLWLILQAALWAAVLLAASRVDHPGTLPPPDGWRRNADRPRRRAGAALPDRTGFVGSSSEPRSASERSAGVSEPLAERRPGCGERAADVGRRAARRGGSGV